MAKLLTKSLAEDFSAVTFSFADDTVITQVIDDLPDEIVSHLAAHGLSQKCGDSTAGLGDDVAKAKENVQKVLNDLAENNWTTRTAGGGPRLSLLVEALARLSGQTTEECLTVVEGMDDAAKKALRAADPIKIEMAKIKLEKAEAAQKEPTEEAPAIDFTQLFNKEAAA